MFGRITRCAASGNVVARGGNRSSGSAPLKRTIQSQLLDPLATKLLLGEFRPGDRVKVTAQDGESVFQ